MNFFEDYDLGPLQDLGAATSDRILLRMPNMLAAEALERRSTAVVQDLIAAGWQLHAPLFDTAAVTVVPRSWEGVAVYNLNALYYERTKHGPVAANPTAMLEDMAHKVTAQDGVKRAVFLPLIDLYDEWMDGQVFSAALRSAAQAILNKDSGVPLVIASTMQRSKTPAWAPQFRTEWSAEREGVKRIR